MPRKKSAKLLRVAPYTTPGSRLRSLEALDHTLPQEREGALPCERAANRSGRAHLSGSHAIITLAEYYQKIGKEY